MGHLSKLDNLNANPHSAHVGMTGQDINLFSPSAIIIRLFFEETILMISHRTIGNQHLASGASALAARNLRTALELNPENEAIQQRT